MKKSDESTCTRQDLLLKNNTNTEEPNKFHNNLFGVFGQNLKFDNLEIEKTSIPHRRLEDEFGDSVNR